MGGSFWKKLKQFVIMKRKVSKPIIAKKGLKEQRTYPSESPKGKIQRGFFTDSVKKIAKEANRAPKSVDVMIGRMRKAEGSNVPDIVLKRKILEEYIGRLHARKEEKTLSEIARSLASSERAIRIIAKKIGYKFKRKSKKTQDYKNKDYENLSDEELNFIYKDQRLNKELETLLLANRTYVQRLKGQIIMRLRSKFSGAERDKAIEEFEKSLVQIKDDNPAWSDGAVLLECLETLRKKKIL